MVDLEPSEGVRRGRLVRGESVATAPLYPVSRLLRKSLAEVEAVRQSVLAEVEAARARADEIIATAQRRAEEIEAAAQLEAVRVAKASGEEAQRKVSERAEALLASIHQAVEAWTKRYPNDVAAFAFKLARKVVDCEFAARPERVLEFVRMALEKARYGATGVVIYLHPEDVLIVQPAAGQLATKLRLAEPPAIVEDKTLQRSAVRVEIGANRAAYHASVESAFTELRKQLERGRI